MYKSIFILIILIFISKENYAGNYSIWNHPNQKQSFALQQDLRLFYKLSPSFKLLFEAQAKELLTVDDTNDNWETNKKKMPEVLAFRIGGLYRAARNLKIGLSYQSYNRRNFLTGNLNYEHIPILDIIPRFKLSDNLVFEFRLRNEFNYYNESEQSREHPLWYSIKIRPKFSYFLFDELDLTLIAFISYEAYLPINYSISHLEHWAYAGVTIPITNYFSVSPYYAMRYLDSTSVFTTSMTHIFGTGFTFDF